MSENTWVEHLLRAEKIRIKDCTQFFSRRKKRPDDGRIVQVPVTKETKRKKEEKGARWMKNG